MKSIIAMAVSLMFVFGCTVLAAEEKAMPAKCAEHMKAMDKAGCGRMDECKGMKACPLCTLNADFKVKDTKDGVIVEVTGKKDGDDAMAIQAQFKKWLESKQNMGGAKPAGQAVKEGDEIVTCPVMGTKFKKSQAYSSWVYKGKTYYFCCAMCPEKFKADPGKYVK